MRIRGEKIRKIAKIFIGVVLCISLIGSLAACAGSTSNTEKTTSNTAVNSAVDTSQKEAPMLAEEVKAGNLPSVDKRLPENPLVITPYEGLGQYGGTWQQSVTVGTKGHAFSSIGYYEGRNLLTWSMDKKKIIPNIASDVKLSPDAKLLTVTLRKGLKWSDGEDMTTDDVEFWWKAYAINQTVSPGSKTWNDCTLTIVDKQTFTMQFQEARPFILNEMADGTTGSYWFLPKHYLGQFHKDYNADADAVSKKLNFDDWTKCFLDRMDYLTNQGLPVMGPWVLKTSGSAASTLTFERNPYYFGVDTAGRQLPYIDKCIVNICESDEMVKMKAVSGEFDLAFACVAENFSDYPLYAQSADSGGYTVKTADYDEPNALNIHINLSDKDLEKRKYMGNVQFRQALSLAINRQEIVDTQYTVGDYKADIRQFSPCPTSPYFDKDMSTQYTQYDVAQANKLLDGLGLTNKNTDGYRLLSNGQAFSIVIDVPNYSSQWIDVAAMIAKYWQDVGINASARSIDPSLWDTRIANNDFDCTVMTGGGGFANLSNLDVNDLTGYDFLGWPQTFASANYTYRSSKGKSGVEPSDAVKQLWQLGESLVHETDKQKQDDLAKQILKIQKDNLFVLGICTRLPAVYLVKNYMHNVPPLDPSWTYGYTGFARPEQYYIVK